MRESDKKLTKHHIVPRSKGGYNNDKNIAMVKQGLHRKYHGLFANKTPNEILSFLEDYFWGGDKRFIDKFRKEGFFDD